MDTKTTIIVSVLSSGGLFAIVGAIINGAFTKRKLGAEATQIITQAASGVVADLRQSLADASVERERVKTETAGILATMRADHQAALEKQAAEFAEEREDWRRVLQLHVAWDYIAIERLSHLGIELPPPPPIMPAGR